MPQVYLVFIVVVMELIGLGMIIPLSPYMARDLGADDLQVGLLMSIYSLIQCVVSPLWGRWSDYVGRKSILLMSLFFTSLSYFWFFLAPNLMHLFFSRALAGCFGVSVSTSLAYISDQTAVQNRSRDMALVGAAFGIGFIVGPFLTGILSQTQSQQAALGASMVVFLGFLIALLTLKESHKKYSLKSHVNIFQIFSSRILSQPSLVKVLLIFFTVSLSLTLVEAPLFLLMKDQFDWPLQISSFGFAYIGFILALTQGFMVRFWIPLWGEKNINFVGIVLLSSGLLSLSFDHIAIVGLGVTFMSLGFGLCSACLTGGISLLGSQREQGGTMGVQQSLSSLSRILGPILGGWLYRDVNHEAPFIVAGVLASLSLCLSYFFRKIIPSKGKLQKKSDLDKLEYLKINKLQLQNLLEGRIPFSFFYLKDVTHYKEDIFFQDSRLKSILSRAQKIELSELKRMKFSSPVVLICKDGTLSQKQALEMFDRWKNVFYLEGGVNELLKNEE